jgi:hypothetical protein
MCSRLLLCESTKVEQVNWSTPPTAAAILIALAGGTLTLTGRVRVTVKFTQ